MNTFLNTKASLLCYVILIGAACSVVLSSPVWACSIPVFQYALRYWPADPYGVIVFHRGPLSPEDQAVVDRLRKVSLDDDSRANFIMETIDLAGRTPSVDETMRELWEDQPASELPGMVVRYPRFSGILDDAWAGRFTADAVEALLDSPVRREIARRILDGEAAVWVFLESGIQPQDDAAAQLLKIQLRKMSETLKTEVPGGNIGQFDAADLGVKFSMVRLSRDDPDERVFAQMLLHIDRDLETLLKPMAFPIFGRGRALYVLVGDGIAEGNIESMCSFLVGWCSCQIKEQNPGVDILMSVNWYSTIDDRSYGQTTQPLNFTRAPETEGGTKNPIKRNVLIVLLIQVIIVVLLGLTILWRKRQRTSLEE